MTIIIIKWKRHYLNVLVFSKRYSPKLYVYRNDVCTRSSSSPSIVIMDRTHIWHIMFKHFQCRSMEITLYSDLYQKLLVTLSDMYGLVWWNDVGAMRHTVFLNWVCVSVSSQSPSQEVLCLLGCAVFFCVSMVFQLEKKNGIFALW